MLILFMIVTIIALASTIACAIAYMISERSWREYESKLIRRINQLENAIIKCNGTCKRNSNYVG